jgi:geranylgeranyl pyrophosphate synthase
MLDDLPSVDNAAFRRSRPACHMIFGEAVTIYASHLLYALAERISSENAMRFGANEKSVWRHFAELRERLVECQVIEINLSKGSVLPDDAILRKFYELKGSPFVSSVWLAASLGKVETLVLERLTEYAQCLGIAYQIADDIADVRGDTSKMGKMAGMDQGKINFVTHLGVDSSRRLGVRFMSRAQEFLDLIPLDTAVLTSLMRDIVGPVLSMS